MNVFAGSTSEEGSWRETTSRSLCRFRRAKGTFLIHHRSFAVGTAVSGNAGGSSAAYAITPLSGRLREHPTGSRVRLENRRNDRCSHHRSRNPRNGTCFPDDGTQPLAKITALPARTLCSRRRFGRRSLALNLLSLLPGTGRVHFAGKSGMGKTHCASRHRSDML